jgi:hypothetical protein
VLTRPNVPCPVAGGAAGRERLMARSCRDNNTPSHLTRPLIAIRRATQRSGRSSQQPRAQLRVVVGRLREAMMGRQSTDTILEQQNCGVGGHTAHGGQGM